MHPVRAINLVPQDLASKEQVMENSEYRMSHQDPGHGERYEQMYGRGYYKYIWNDVERPLLDRVLGDVAADTDGSLLVDLACGTGRVTEVAVPHFDEVIGMDVSEDMLEIARKRRAGHPNVRFVRGDLMDESSAEEFGGFGKASCVTAFRLFTNADPDLRKIAAEFAYKALKPGGRVVANCHMTPRSPVGRIYLAEHRLRARAGRSQRMFNKVLAPEALRDLLLSSGFADVEIRPYAAFPGIPKLWRLVPAGVVERAERRFGGRRWNQCALVIATR
jgi:SAM-dependent methyltransferase